jgi:hypothetical protein
MLIQQGFQRVNIIAYRTDKARTKLGVFFKKVFKLLVGKFGKRAKLNQFLLVKNRNFDFRITYVYD